MRTQWDEIWRFETARFAVIAEATPCDENPADHFDDEGQTAKDIEEGRYVWFDARVRVVLIDDEGETLGADVLGCCCYERPIDLFRHHATLTKRLKALRANHRRCQPGNIAKRRAIRQEIAGILKTLRNNVQPVPPVTYCEYGPDMVRLAIREARQHVATFSQAKEVTYNDHTRQG